MDGHSSSAADADRGLAIARVDPATLGKLVGLIGETKVRRLLALLADTLRSQSGAFANTAEGRVKAKGQAHAAIAGAGMLGFTDFVAACRELEATPDDDTFGTRLAGFRRAAEAVAAVASDLSRQEAPLAVPDDSTAPLPAAP